MATEGYSVSQAARRVGVSVSTLRAWCAVYAEFLSGGANPAAGAARALSAADCEVLRAVVQLRANGLDAAQIAARLRADGAAGLQQATEGLQAPAVATVQSSAADTLAAFVVAADGRLSDVAARVESLDRRVAASESTRRLVLAVLVAFACGVAVATAVAVLVFIMSRP